MEKNNHENILNLIQLEKLDKYAELIYLENKKYNLTGLKNVKDIKNVLISESITAINYPNINLRLFQNLF